MPKISATEFAELWGTDELRRADPASAHALGLASSALTYLLEVGLPARADFRLEFLLDPKLPHLSEVVTGRRPEESIVLSRYRQLAFNGIATHICLEHGTGRVVSVVLRNVIRVRFVNSGIPELAESLLAYRTIRKEYPGNDEIAYARFLAKELSDIDPQALDSPDNWWSQVVDDAEAGVG